MPTLYPIVPGVAKIAVLRANALGDYIVAIPALDALRAAYPEAEIVLLATAWQAAFLTGRPGPVDRVVMAPPSTGVNGNEQTAEDPARLEAFFDAARQERFDVAVQIHGGGRYSNPFLLRLGARLSIGLRTPDAAPLDRWVPYTPLQHETLRHLEVVSLAGAPPTTLEPAIPLVPSDLAEAAAVVPVGDRPLAVLHAGATARQRRWPPEKFARVGDRLAAAGAHVLLTGTAPEQPLVDAVRRAMRADATDLCGRLSLGGAAGLLSRCRVVVSNDTGLLHLAAAVGARTVGIYWCWNLFNYGPLTRTRHRPVASWRLDCPRCGANQLSQPCGHEASMVADISEEEVAQSALDLLADDSV